MADMLISDEERIAALEAEAHALLDEAIEREIKSASRCHIGTVILLERDGIGWWAHDTEPADRHDAELGGPA